MFFGIPGVLLNRASSLESTYNPSVPVSVRGARSLSYTPPSKTRPATTNDIPFWVLERFGSLAAWTKIDPSTSESDLVPIVLPGSNLMSSIWGGYLLILKKGAAISVQMVDDILRQSTSMERLPGARTHVCTHMGMKVYSLPEFEGIQTMASPHPRHTHTHTQPCLQPILLVYHQCRIQPSGQGGFCRQRFDCEVKWLCHSQSQLKSISSVSPISSRRDWGGRGGWCWGFRARWRRTWQHLGIIC